MADGRLIVVMRGSNDQKAATARLPLDFLFPRWRLALDAARTLDVHLGRGFLFPQFVLSAFAPLERQALLAGKHLPRPTRDGNLPRRPFYVGEVDQDTGLLIRDSLILVDDRQPGDDEILMLSNFYAREDRETRQIALHMTRMFAFKDGWVGNAYLYRIDV